MSQDLSKVSFGEDAGSSGHALTGQPGLAAT